MILENNSRFTVSKMCHALDVSRSGYYAFVNRPESARSKRHKELICKIEKIHMDSNRVYGSPNITIALNREGIQVSLGTVARLMRKHGIKSKIRKKYKATTNSKHNLPVADNILNREFDAEKRNQKWVSDITYIWTDEGWLYLAAILDLFDKVIVGWSMDSRMTKQLVINALNESGIRRKPEPGGILHSDRGSQYCSEDYQKEIERWGFICSMSRKRNCWDNAPMESFWGKLKMEWLNERRFKTRDEAKKAVFEYIEIFYNRVRQHSKNGYVPPLEMM